MRILRWIVDRVHGRALGVETAIGWMPHYEHIDWTGLAFPKSTFDALQAFDGAAWRKEVIDHEELFIDLHDHLPSEMIYERELLICRL
jgi:phosphoenolpyruvate carboxykinase (GTP)